jgi:hypothetical protein
LRTRYADGAAFLCLFVTMSFVTEDDPFKDPSLIDGSQPAQTPAANNVPDTLDVGRNASLTLGTDSLVVLGMHRGLN